MKRVILRIGCGAVCAALALTLGCGCALLPPATGVRALPALPFLCPRTTAASPYTTPLC